MLRAIQNMHRHAKQSDMLKIFTFMLFTCEYMKFLYFSYIYIGIDQIPCHMKDLQTQQDIVVHLEMETTLTLNLRGSELVEL